MKKAKRNKFLLDLDNQLEFLFSKGINLRRRIITISDEIEPKLFQRVDAALAEFEVRSEKPVTVRINSPGGDCYAALAIVGRLKSSRCRIITEGYGEIMSAASLILAAGDVRRVSRYAWFLHHQARYRVSGKHSDIKVTVAQMEREELEWCKAMASFTKETAEYWMKLGEGEAYFDARQLKKLGVIDAII